MPTETELSRQDEAPDHRPQRPSSDESSAREDQAATPKQSGWPAIIKAVQDRWGLFTVVSLVVGAAVTGVSISKGHTDATIILSGFGLLALIVVAVTLLHLVDQKHTTSSAERVSPAEESQDTRIEDRKRKLLDENRGAVKDADAPPLTSEGLTNELQQLRSVLHQAARYSTPTYYLDAHLNIIDWNVAFELIFARILHKLRGRHVNHFIAELENCDAVFDHARDFTVKVEQGELPLIDVEPLVYQSDSYGAVQFVKVASQLTDTDAKLQAWAVALLIRQIDWTRFAAELLPRLHEHKRWSIYAASYDTVLLKFPPYAQLLVEVIGGIPRTAKHVMDLGAGTGNVSKALLERGHRVTAVENNLPMLEKLFKKKLDPAGGKLTLSKNSAEDLSSYPDNTFDGVVAVNVLYALDDPLGCIRSVFRVLRSGGVFAFSTTTTETELGPLLAAIKARLRDEGQFEVNQEHYQRVYELNKDIEIKLAKRHTRQDYAGWVTGSGFRISYTNPDAYVGAVTVFHAKKP